MRRQRGDLAFDGGRDVDPDRGLIRPEEVQAPDTMRLEPVAVEPGKRHRVASGRIHGVDGREPGGPVVGVVDAAIAVEEGLGVGRQDRVRSKGPDLADQHLAQREVVGQPAVGLVEERDPGVPDDPGRGPLLRFAERCQRQRIGIRVLATLVATRAADQPALGSVRDPAGGGRSGAELGVVGMGRDDHESVGSPVVRDGPCFGRRHARRPARKPCTGSGPGVRFGPRLRSSPPTSEVSLLPGSLTRPAPLGGFRAR